MTRFVLIIFMFSANVAAAAGDISQFIFTTDSQTIKPNEISQKITIQAQDAGGNSANLAQTACVKLETASGGGEFSSSDTNWNPVNILTMSKGSANRNFYYKDSALGVYELSLNVSLRPEEENSPCASWPIENWDIKWNAKQNITVSSSQNNLPSDNPPSDSNQQQPAAEPTGGFSWPTEEQIFANAGEDKITVAGADLMFSGKALGVKKEPLENARYSWNFGDGAMAEGQNVRHFYKYPGNYIVMLDVSSGKFSASDRLNVKVVPNELQITEANKNFIKLKNKSNVLLDVSGWFLRTISNQTFTFPMSSLIAANSDLIISSDVSKITADGNGELVELLYPNGATAFAYKINSQPLVVSQPEPVKNFTPPARPVSRAKNQPLPVRPASLDEIVEHTVSSITIATSSEQKNQLAGVIAVTDKKDFMEGKWIFLAILLGVFAAGGLFFMRRYDDTSPKSEPDEFNSQN